MKRALPVLGLTATGLGLVLGYETRAVGGPGAGTVVASGVRPPVTGAPSVVPSSSPPPPETVPPETVPPETVPPETVPPETVPSDNAPGGGDPSRGAAQTVDGPAVDTRWGPVQVQVSVSGGSILDVVALQTPSSHRRSQAINQRAVPILHDEVLAAQSARVDVVSGATYTWEGYTTSLQAALDSVGFRG